MPGSSILLAALTGVGFLCGCHYNAELHRLTQERKEYEDMCARGANVWRMFYEGTDSAYHRFLVNDMDRWRHVRIAKSEIVMEEPLPPADTTREYYCVDPCNDWHRVDDCWRKTPRPAQKGR